MRLDLPNLQLLHHYNNEETFLEKVGGVGSASLRLMLGMRSMGASLSEMNREERLRAHAEEMNEAFRALQAAQMQPVISRAQYTRPPMILMARRPEGSYQGLTGPDVQVGMDEGMVRMASAIGADLAVYSLEKEAGIGGALLGAVGSVGKGMTAGAGKAFKGIGAGLGRMGAAVKNSPTWAVGKLESGKNGLLSGIQSMKQSVKNTVNSGTQAVKGTLQNAAQGVKDWNQRVGQRIESAGQRFGGKLEHAGAKVESVGTGKPMPQTTPHPTPTPQAAPTPTPMPAANGAGPTGTPGMMQQAWNRSGLSEGQWKWKLPALAAGAAGMYGLYRGAKKGFDTLGEESAPMQYNAGGARSAAGVNEFGVPER